MDVEHRPERTSHPEQPNEWQASFATALDNVVETLFTREAITERLRGHESDQYLQMSLSIHKQALVKLLAETAEQAIEDFLTHINGLQASPGVPLYPPLPTLSETQTTPRINALYQYKSFTVASICREDLRGILTNEEITALDDTDMEDIADRMSDAYRDSGGYWESLEIMARFVLEKEEWSNVEARDDA